MDTLTFNVKRQADRLINAVARTGVITQDNIQFASQVMKEEMKAFLGGDKYRKEREMILADGPAGYAWAALVAECVSRIRQGA